MKTIRFLDHVASPMQTVVGNKTDNGADVIFFELPSFPGATAFLHFTVGSYTDVVTLPDDHTFRALARHTQTPGEALCYIHIEGTGGIIWHSDPFTLLIGDIPTDSENAIPQTYPTAVDTALSALQQIEALKDDIDDSAEAIEDFSDALSNITVSVTGTAAGTSPTGSAAITPGSGIAFAFTIPKGETGATGAQGATGERGATGATGKGIQSIAVDYQLGTSPTAPPDGQWLVSVPEAHDGDYIWTRTTQTLDDGTVSKGYSVVLFSPTDAEAWAKGTRAGVDVTSADAAYHANAKYFAEAAADSADDAQDAADFIEENIDTIATEDTAQDICAIAALLADTMHSLLLQGDRISVVSSLPENGVNGRVYITPMGVYRYWGGAFRSISSPGLNGFSLHKGENNEVILRFTDEDGVSEETTLPLASTGQELLSVISGINANIRSILENRAESDA